MSGPTVFPKLTLAEYIAQVDALDKDLADYIHSLQTSFKKKIKEQFPRYNFFPAYSLTEKENQIKTAGLIRYHVNRGSKEIMLNEVQSMALQEFKLKTILSRYQNIMPELTGENKQVFSR